MIRNNLLNLESFELICSPMVGSLRVPTLLFQGGPFYSVGNLVYLTYKACLVFNTGFHGLCHSRNMFVSGIPLIFFFTKRYFKFFCSRCTFYLMTNLNILCDI